MPFSAEPFSVHKARRQGHRLSDYVQAHPKLKDVRPKDTAQYRRPRVAASYVVRSATAALQGADRHDFILRERQLGTSKLLGTVGYGVIFLDQALRREARDGRESLLNASYLDYVAADANIDEHAEIGQLLAFTASGLHRARYGGGPGEHSPSPNDDFRLMTAISQRGQAGHLVPVDHAPVGLRLVPEDTGMRLDEVGGPTLISAETPQLARYLSWLTQMAGLVQVYASENLQPYRPG
jgi:hypothetical protein